MKIKLYYKKTNVFTVIIGITFIISLGLTITIGKKDLLQFIFFDCILLMSTLFSYLRNRKESFDIFECERYEVLEDLTNEELNARRKE